ncbi:ABC-F family ATP-binding cassette domain-containing protein [Spirochaeta africana]|uniref:ATPase component of ABC transporters with duplicated ATPase domain n=1 Tax=Spirochaeta africana (strain ATCC 700263 / DSM 8902 / Z-7692) TaxID=889378 RepID=H9UK34_SPIAZ|nr:ABC-F family ATP-binding cassette domain-containing protein [Spirochaeta africana]AFG37877.1 ATPase component of ABC transporters with duplicated ATPase domain [Spirochaeta africana DSM 8902]
MAEYHLQASQISHSFGAQTVFDQVSLKMRSGDRIALAGSNGSGKTTFMRILSGQLQPDSGTIHLSRNARIGYLPQQGVPLSGHSIFAETEQVFDHIATLIQRRQQLGEKMAAGDHNPAVLEEYGALQEHIEHSGYYQRESVIESTLKGLGFHRSDLERPCAEFSGGWRMRIALAKILIDRPDFLLLDEPTNYLDIEAREWLEAWMNRFEGGILLVAHDRYFLDTTMNQVVELFQSRLRRYPGSYTRYEQVRTGEIMQLTREYEQQQSEIARHEDFVRRFRYNARKAKQVQSRIKMLEKIDTIELPPHLKPIAIPMPEPPHSGKDVLTLNGLSKSYGNLQVLNHLDLSVQRGECIALTGKNGMGKSTLLRILAGVDTSFDGGLQLGSGVSVGFYAQESAYSLPEEPGILEYLEEQAPRERAGSVRSLLGAFLFHGDDVFKPIGVLSGGERSRVALLEVLLQPVNLLLLDEPTNHLDIVSQDVLAEALTSFGGTAVVVSHDHDFLERIATRVIELGPRSHRNFPGDYRYYLQRIQQESAESPGASSPAATVAPDTAGGAAQQDYTEQKRIRSRIQKLEKQEAAVVAEMETADQEVAWLQQRLSDPEVYTDGEQVQQVQEQLLAAQERQEHLAEQWEKIDTELNELRSPDLS